jgi:(1->4)-alpha-D-glucan 1-alpha-D-glucosylmutase
MAKGKEDTAFYRELRLVSRCEVGDDPFATGLDMPVLHTTFEQLATDGPRTMTALTTHDTKRSEDVRARLSVLSELPEAWAEVARSWMARTATLDGDAVLEPSSRYRLLQNLVGAHPVGVERLEAFALKAEREAKEHTSWTRPDAAYEAALVALVRAVGEDPELTDAVSTFVGAVLDPPGRRSEVAQKVLQLMAPGVADLYWGSEDRLHRLVDPDNRVAPDLAALRARLARVRDTAASAAVADDPDGPDAKLFAVATVLELRRRHAACCAGGAYEPLEVVGDDAERVAAFRRGEDLAVLVTRWPVRGPVLAATTVELPTGSWRTRLGAVDEPSQPRAHGGVAPVAELLGGWSAAVLERVA